MIKEQTNPCVHTSNCAGKNEAMEIRFYNLSIHWQLGCFLWRESPQIRCILQQFTPGKRFNQTSNQCSETTRWPETLKRLNPTFINSQLTSLNWAHSQHLDIHPARSCLSTLWNQSKTHTTMISWLLKLFPFSFPRKVTQKYFKERALSKRENKVKQNKTEQKYRAFTVE